MTRACSACSPRALPPCPSWARSCSAIVCVRSRCALRPSFRCARPSRVTCSTSNWARAVFRRQTLLSTSTRTSATRRLRVSRRATSFAWTRVPAPRLVLPRTWASMPSTCSTACRFPRRVPCLSTACLRARPRSKPIAMPHSAARSSAWIRSARWTLRCRHLSRPRYVATRSMATSGSARLSTWASAASWPTIWAWAKHCR